MGGSPGIRNREWDFLRGWVVGEGCGGSLDRISSQPGECQRWGWEGFWTLGQVMSTRDTGSWFLVPGERQGQAGSPRHPWGLGRGGSPGHPGRSGQSGESRASRGSGPRGEHQVSRGVGAEVEPRASRRREGKGLTMCWSLSRCTTRAVHSPMGTRSGEAL